ncbi:hypothetical protein U9M48_028661 [Paspalum notatum var. saurae]|uniref:Uncharacterized protein n=1 Tax=Paspalum notatum var. saurae TaxID=547442 RepID=A0AAQ3X0G3_PASNO
MPTLTPRTVAAAPSNAHVGAVMVSPSQQAASPIRRPAPIGNQQLSSCRRRCEPFPCCDDPPRHQRGNRALATGARAQQWLPSPRLVWLVHTGGGVAAPCLP